MTGTTKKKKTPARRRTTSRPQGRLAGKVALVTGAAGNIGVTIVRRFLDEGAAVVASANELRPKARRRVRAGGCSCAGARERVPARERAHGARREQGACEREAALVLVRAV